MDEKQLSGPVKDPSELTTQQILREVNTLEKLFSQRMDAIERAVAVAHENLVRVPTETQKAVSHLEEVIHGKLQTVSEKFNVHLEKFANVSQQFSERDVRAAQVIHDSKIAVEAALKAAKEAVDEQNRSSALAIGKAEAATNKQIDQLGALIQSTISGINAQIGDLKDRLTRFEGQDRGKDTQRQLSASAVGVIGVVIGALIGLGGLLLSFTSKQQAPGVAATGAPPAIVYMQPAPAAAPPPSQGSK